MPLLPACSRLRDCLLGRWLLPLAGVFALGGCAYAPGMNFSALHANTNSTPNPWSITTARGDKPGTATDATGQALPFDPPPPGSLIPITADLIKQQRAGRPASISAEAKLLLDTPASYKIGPSDVLNIVVWEHPELTMVPATSGGTETASLAGVGNGFNVSPNGQIQFPYVGVVKVGGLTEYEARDLLTKRLGKYIKDPQITVRIQSYRSGRVYVDGEIRTPGLQSLNDVPMTLPEAIGRAGGFTPNADRSTIYVTRGDTTTTINLAQFTEHGVNPSNILLKGGDMVRVLSREDSKVFVMGEVLRPVTQTMRNGRLTLNEALGDSGGVDPTSGDPRQIFVVRTTQSTTHPQVFHLDASTPVAFALAEGFELQARDVVYVDPIPLIRWNHVVNLVLPSATAINLGRTVTR